MGCGTGLNFARVLAQLDAPTGRLTGVDFSEAMLRRAQHRIAARGWTNVELVQVDAGLVSLPRRFEAVLFAYSLAMIRDWQGAIRNAAAHLSPGGRLVVLEFGTFGGWGQMGAGVRRWLRWHHVETRRPYVEVLRETFDEVRVEHRLGGYYFIARAIGRA
jgi:S-adenosylmethionine-diacylgycerolhomoserine-N-methlytransferase